MTSAADFGKSLYFVWEEYRKASARSRALKTSLTRWRLVVLALIVSGSVFGILADQSTNWLSGAVGGTWLPKVFAALGAIALGLMAFLSKEILGSDSERRWVFARSQAEALKSEAYKFLVKASPYDAPNANEILAAKAHDLLDQDVDIIPVDLSETDKRRGLPDDWLTLEDYIEQRVQMQIDGFYEPRARDHHRTVKLLRTAGLAIGALGVVLGGIGAGVENASWTAGWIAVVGTIAGALAAYGSAGRYEYLVISYELTARRLRWLVAESGRVVEAEKSAAAGSYILEFENAISIENGNWLAEWRKTPKEFKPSEGKSNPALQKSAAGSR